MRTATAAISIGLLLVTLTSCGGATDTAGASDTSGAGKPASPTSRPAPTPTASQAGALPAEALKDAEGLTFSAPPADPLDLGVPWKWTRFSGRDAKSTGTTTVLDYQQYMAPDPGRTKGMRYNELTVRICSSTGLPITVNQRFFALVEASGRVNQTKLGFDPKKAFPTSITTLAPGQCAHGTIDFFGAANDTTMLAVWGPNGAPRPVIWVIPE